MKSALIRLRETMDQFSSTERMVAEYILAHPEEVISQSVQAVSQVSFSSPSTIVRMCRRIGFEGYRELRQALIYEMALRKHNEEEYSKEITRSDSMKDLIAKITYKNIVSLEDTKNLLDPETLSQCVKLLSQCNTILLFGIGASLCAARDAYLKFLRLGKSCVVNDDWHSQLLQAKNATEKDIGIIFSYSGETGEMIACMKAMQENRTPMIAITRCVSSPVSRLADYNLYTASNESIFRSGAMSSRISQLNIIDILYTAFANLSCEHLEEQLNKTHISKEGGV